MKDNLTNFMVVSGDGEVMCHLTERQVTYIDKTNNSASPESKNNNSGIDMKGSSDLFHMYIKETCGSFFHKYYGNGDDYKYIFRFLYLCTFMNYKGYLEYGKSDFKLIKRSALKEILNLNNNGLYDTINYLFEKEMLVEDEDAHIKINNELCNRGKLSDGNKGVVRMFDAAIKELYESSKPKEHDKIGLLIRLLPYVHYNTNIICSNPSEELVQKIKPLKQKEILDILGITKPTALSLIGIKIMGGTESAFIKTSNAFIKNFYIINPRFMFKGNSYEIHQEYLALFQVGYAKR